MTMLKKMRENKKKGFTLVELIVVLVILAILAALLIPALTGYIDKARNKSVVAETRQAVMAAQTILDEKYGKETTEQGETKLTTYINGDTVIKEIENLAEVEGGTVSGITVSGAKVSKLVYNNGNKTCTYILGATNGTDGAYDVVNN